MKRLLKWTGTVSLSALVLAAGFAGHEWYAEKPIYLNNYLNRELLKEALETPQQLTSLGFLETVGIDGHNAKLNDLSPERYEELHQRLLKGREVLLQYDDARLSEQERLSKAVALYLVEQEIEGYPFRFHNYPVNQLFGVQSWFPSFMDSQHQITDYQSVEHYLSRLAAVDNQFQQLLVGLKQREKRGVLPPRFVVDRVLDEMSGFVDTQPKDNILYTSLAKRLSESEVDTNEHQALLAATEQAIQSQVYPAYQRLIDYFSSIRAHTTSDDGVWKLPDGDDYYRFQLKRQTTTELTPERIHDIGLAEVARIQSQIIAILQQQGISDSNDFSTAIKALAAQEDQYYPDTDEGRAKILQEYRDIITEIESNMTGVFGRLPEAGVEVRRIPEFKEKTAPGAYYMHPSIDGSRPGRFFANLYDIKATPKYGMRTLAYHEAVPGHHFQIALAMETEGIPFIRRASPFTAFTEGWALYAEYLAWEMGMQEQPLDNVGRLQAELFRAVRLVVDTGLHAKRWTREQAIDYMAANTGTAMSDVVSEIERYIVNPGQATAYKVGMMKILELRERSRKALGDHFDLADFHDEMLRNGALPMALLEKSVDRYIAQHLPENHQHIASQD